MLNVGDIRLLQFERDTPNSDRKPSRIRETFGISEARYWQRLNHVIDDPAAVVRDPVLVHRLLRLRDARLSARNARELGHSSDRLH